MKYCSFGITVFFVTNFFGSLAYAHSSPLNGAAVQACLHKEKSQACQYTGHHDDLYIGTCQLITEVKLSCVRNKPIQTSMGVNKKLEESGELDSSNHNENPNI